MKYVIARSLQLHNNKHGFISSSLQHYAKQEYNGTTVVCYYVQQNQCGIIMMCNTKTVNKWLDTRNHSSNTVPREKISI
jgi:hypothetical protein